MQFSFDRSRRQFAVSRIDDERGAMFEVAIRKPVLTVGTGGAQSGRRLLRQEREVQPVAKDSIRFRREEIPCAALHRRQFLIGQTRLVRELSRPLERRCAVVLPHAFQAGATISGARRRPRRWVSPIAAGGLSFDARLRHGRQQDGERERYGRGVSAHDLHLTTPREPRPGDSTGR
jgi:hypothetical protein